MDRRTDFKNLIHLSISGMNSGETVESMNGCENKYKELNYPLVFNGWENKYKE
jgi:hypothetical protein